MKCEIEKFNPCREALEFRKQYPTLLDAWNACPRGDWMLWIAKKAGVDIRLLTLAKGKCAETVKHLMKDDRSIKAVEAAIAFGEGRINEDELKAAAAYAADAAADAAAAYAYAAAAYAADAAADAAAAYAADAAYAAAAYAYAADAAAYAAADAARTANRKKTADICRAVLQHIVVELLVK
jgi:hypothetical protein